METKIVVKYVQYMNENECVREWLSNRPAKTQEAYSSFLQRFCEFVKVTPEEFQGMDKKMARDVAWKYLVTLNTKESASVAITAMAALKSFYRNGDGETLPFDSTKHGKHYVKPHAKKALYEHTPSKNEVYQIIDKAMSLRDSTMMLVLYQSGIRENALLNLTYGMVREQLERNVVPLHLKITSEIDSKLCGYDLPFYDAFVSKEAVDSLRKYCAKEHKGSTDETTLFRGRCRGKKMVGSSIWQSFKNATERAGFDKKTMWVHSLRKSFKGQVRKSNVQEELSECLMGHRLKGSRESYMNRSDALEELRIAYEQVDFSREGKTEKPVKETKVKTKTQEPDTKNKLPPEKKEKTTKVAVARNDLSGDIKGLKTKANGKTYVES